MNANDTNTIRRLPMPQLIALFNAVSGGEPIKRFDTRTKGENRLIRHLEAKRITLHDGMRKARLLDITPDNLEQKNRELAERCEPVVFGPGGLAAGMPSHPGLPDREQHAVDLFAATLAKSDRPAFVNEFIRRLLGEKPVSTGSSNRQLTEAQTRMVTLCMREEGATGAELAAANGWPSIAARTTLQRLADRYGYILTETPRTKDRGISFHLAHKAKEAA